MTTASNVNPPRRRNGRRTSVTQGAQWQFQADLLDQLSDAVIAVDLDECITYLNRAAVAQYGIDPAGAIGQPLSHLYRYEWLQPEDELLADAALAQQGRWRGENRHIRRDGSTLHVESLVTVLRDAMGNATGLLATVRDITDRKQMERDLRASELRYRRLADTLPQLVWTASATGITDYYNIHIHDFDPSVWQGAAGFDWESLLHPDDLAPTLVAWQQAVTQRRPYTCEHRLLMADGSWRWHLSRAMLVQDPENGLRWSGTATDIHERKAAEEALRANQERLQLGIQVAGLVLAEVDYTTNLIHLDPAAATLYGLPAGVGTAPRAAVHATFHPDDAPEILRRMHASFDPTGPGWFAMAHRVVHPDGAIRWLYVRKQIFFATDADGTRRPVRALLAAFDITEQKAAEEQLAFHASLLDYAYDGVIATDADLNITAWNRGAEEAYGWRAAEVRGRKPYDVLRSSMTPAARAEAVRQMAESGRFRVEATLHHRDGTAIIVEGQTVAMRNATGQVTGYITVNRDIRERKAAEAALRISEERYRTLFERMEEGFCVFEMLYDVAGQPIDYRFLEVNPAFARFTGLENAVGKTAYELTPNLEAHWVAIYGEVARTGEARHFIEGSAALGRWFEVYAFRFGGPESRRVALLFTNITERKLTEDALRDSEEELRYTVELNPQVPWTADAAGNITSFNQRWLDLTGMTEDEALGGGWVQAPHPDDRPAMVTAWTHAIQSGDPYDIEHRIRLADGGYRWMRSRAFPRRDQSGAIVRWYGTTEDIHEQKVTQEALRQSESAFRILADAAPALVWVCSPDGNNIYMNARWHEYTGQSKAEAAGFGWATTMHPTDAAAILPYWEQCRATGQTYEGEVRYRRHDGEYRWHLFRALPRRGDAGRIEAWYGCSVDIHQAKVNEQALRQATTRFERAERAAHGFVFESDLVTGHVTRSPNFTGVTGYTQEEVPPTPEGWLTLIHPDDLVRFAEQNLLADSATSYNGEYRVRHKEGHYFWMQEQGLIERDASGRALAIIGTTLDVTARKSAEEALQTSEARFRTLANTVPSIIWTAAPDGTITYANDHWFDYCGLTPEANAQQWPQLVLHPDDFERCVTQWSDALESGEAYTIEVRNRRYDGVYRWFLTRATPLHDAEGRVTAWFGVTTDIDERKQAELHQQFLLDLDSYTRLLDDAETILATTAERLGQYLGLAHCTFNEIDPATDRGVTLAHWRRDPALPDLRGAHALSTHVGMALAQALAAGESIAVTDVAHDPRTALLVERYAQVGLRSIARAPFNLKGALLAVLAVADAQPRVWRADEIRLLENIIAHIWPLVVKVRAEQALRASEERLRLATEAGGVGIFDHDLITNQTEISAVYAQITGLPLVKAMQREQWLARVHPEDRPLVEAIWENARATGASYYYECRLIRPDGVLVWIEVNAWVTTNAVGEGIRITGAIRDITERKQAALHQQFLLNLNSSLRTLTDAAAIQRTVVERLGEYLGADRCRFNAIDLAADKATLLAAWSRPGLAPPGDITSLSAHAPTAYIASAQSGRTLVVHDVSQDEQNETAKPLLLSRGYAATIRVPCLREGQWVATLHVLQTTPRQWRADEVQLVENVVHHFWPLVEKARAEAEGQRINERFTLAEAAVPGWIYDYDWRTGAVMRSDGFARVLGYAPEECQPTTAWWQSLIHPDDWQWLAQEIGPLSPQGDQRRLEYRVRDRTGHYHYIWDRAHVFRDESGAIIRIVGSSVDISERKAMEEALRQNEARYRTIFEHAGVSLWEEDFSRVKRAVDELCARWRAAGVTDLAAAMRTHCAVHPDFVETMLTQVHILNVNEETMRLYGRPKADLLRPFAHHFDAETLTRFIDQLALLAAGGQRYHFDGPITTPQGEVRHIAFTVVFPADAEGDFTRVLLSGLDVTPLKAAEVENRRLLLATQSLLAQVQEGERFLQSIADTVPNVIYLFDLRHNRNRYANRQVAVTLGYSAAEAQALGDQLITTLLHPEDQTYLADHLAHLRSLADGEMAEWEYRMQHKSGAWRWLNSREIIFERDEQGVPTVILGALQDSTARKEAEVALRASEARFRHLAEAMPQLVWTCRADGSLTYINQQWHAYSGIAPAVTVDEGMWPAMHPVDEAANRDQWRQALTSGEAYEGEVRLRRHDGAYRWFLERAIPVRDETDVIQQWFGVSMEIHDRKEAEQRQAELVALLEAMLDNAPFGFAFLDREQRFVRINQMLADQHGCPIADHIGRPLAEIAPHSAKGVGPILAQVFASGEGVYNREISGPKVANPSEIVHVLASWFPVVVNGVTQYVGSMMVDITERKRQERHQQFLSELGMDLRLLSDSAIILTQLVSRLGEYLQVAGCRVNEVDPQRAQFTLQKDWAAVDAPWPAVVTPGVYPLNELASPALLAALQAGQTVVVTNTLHDLRTAPVANNYEDDQVHSLIGVPIFRQGEWRATLSVKGHGERHWRSDEVALVEAVAGQLSALLEKVRAEEALRASEEIARRQLAEIEAIYATAPVGLAVLDSALRYVRVNAQLAELNGIPVAEHLGRTGHEIIPEVMATVEPLLRQVIATGQPLVNLEIVGEIRQKPGVQHVWLESFYPLHNQAGAVIGINTMVQEITERKAAEERLRQSEERLRLALVGGGMGIWESQVATNRTLWSPEEYRLFDLPVNVEITNALFNRLIHPDDLPGLQAAMQSLFNSGRDHIGEFRIIRPDGAVRWLADRVTVIRDEAGQPVRLLGINFDITERKEREAMIHQQLAEIEAIYATAPIGLCLMDRDLRYVRINETLATINGSTIADQLGRTLAETLPPEGYQIVAPLYGGVIATGTPLLHQEVHESYVDPAQARDWLASYYPLKNGEGMVTGVNAVILEITERKRHERQLQELNASLEERVRERTKALEQANRALSITNRELEQFTYAAAHDLRTPLRGIANLVQWISEDAAPVLSLESQRHLDKLGGRVKRLEKMLEDMLAYSRIGRVRYQPETVDVQQLVQSLIDLLAPPTGFVMQAAGPLPTFTALRIPLELVFRNLLGNAIRHHHEPASGQAVVAVRDLESWYEFCVSDNGPGIDPQYHERIFGMFQTLKPRDQVEGSGIGLALVKKTVESVGGQVRMESTLGQGTSFYFTWPKTSPPGPLS